MKRTPENKEHIESLVLIMAECFGKRFTLQSAVDQYCYALMDIVRNVSFDNNRKYGMINDIEWIIREIYQNCERFPTIKEIRDMYSVHLIPYDELEMRGFSLEDVPLTRKQIRDREEAFGGLDDGSHRPTVDGSEDGGDSLQAGGGVEE